MKKKLFFLLIGIFFVEFASAQKHNNKNLVFILIDGYRWQEVFRGADSTLLANKKYRKQDSAAIFKKYWANTVAERRQKLMPFFWKVLAKQGQLYGNRDLGNLVNVRNKYWFSYPGRSETITGYYDEKINSNEYPNNPNENVFEYINKQHNYAGKVVTFAGWDAVKHIVNRDRNKMPLYNPFENVISNKLTEAQQLANEIQHYLPNYFGTSVRWDATTYAMAKTYISANHPKVVYIDFADTDDLGHAGQYDFYLDAGRYLDEMIGKLWQSMQADPFYKNNTTFVICPDHGRGLNDKWISHGASIAHANETWLAVIGPDIPANGEMKDSSQIYQDQIAQTMAKLLGFYFKSDHPVGASISTVAGK